MRTILAVTVLPLAAILLAIGPAGAQQATSAPKGKTKPAPGMKTCAYKFPDGERRTWTCRKEEPCCAWDAIKYVKCGSTITNCL